MNELTFYYSVGMSIVPALIAFAATFIIRKAPFARQSAYSVDCSPQLSSTEFVWLRN